MSLQDFCDFPPPVAVLYMVYNVFAYRNCCYSISFDDVDEEMEEYDDEEDYMKDDEEGEEGEGEEEEDDKEYNNNDGNKVSEYISEAEEGEDNSDEELTEELCKALHEDLLLLRKRQGQEHSAFIKHSEEMAMAWEGKEVMIMFLEVLSK